MPDSPARVLAMVYHCAAYLHARAHVTPEISVDQNRAVLHLDVSKGVLVAVFGCRKRKRTTGTRATAGQRRLGPRTDATLRERRSTVIRV